MKIRIIKESKLLQEQAKITTKVVQDDSIAYQAIFTIDTGQMIVKQKLLIMSKSIGSAATVFDEQLPKVQKCFPKPPEKTYKGDTLDPVHQIQVDYGYVIQKPEHAINAMSQKIYSHDNNIWLLSENRREDIKIWDIDFHILEVNNIGVTQHGGEYNTNPFNNFSVSMAFFRKLTELIGEYVAKYPYRFYYFFGIGETGESADLPTKRTKLYTTMLKKMFKQLGGTWVQFEEVWEKKSDPNSVFFFKCPGGPVTESRKRKFYLTKKDKKLIQEAYNKEIERFLSKKR
jgi:hypothetical protein